MELQPIEILEHILRFVPNLYLTRCIRINKKWKNLIENKILFIEIPPTMEACIINLDYYHFRRYLNEPFDEYQLQLIKLVNSEILIKYFFKGRADDLEINKNNLFIEYCTRNQVEAVTFLLDNGVNIHVDNDEALRRSVFYKNFEVVKLLIEKGANIHAGDDDALRRSAINGDIKIIKLLLDNEANIHVDNDSSLLWSASGGHFEVVKLLLEKGIDIHALNDDALRWSAFRGHIEVVKLLLEPWIYIPSWPKEKKGADVHSNNNNALLWSAQAGHLEIVKLLVEKGADLYSERNYLLRNCQHGHKIWSFVWDYCEKIDQSNALT
jgi:ankyrin repeat protein